MFIIPRTLDEWNQGKAEQRLQDDPTFLAWRDRHPLQARFWLAFCRHYDLGFEAFHQGDAEQARVHKAAMKELVSWLDDEVPRATETPEEAFTRLLEEGFSNKRAFKLAKTSPTRGKGRPVSVRWPALQAHEQKLQDDRSWRELTAEFCRCGQTKHARECQEKLRLQVVVLKKTIQQLGV